jgi:hypothetical protein
MGGKWVLFERYEESSDRQNLARVPLAGGTASPVWTALIYSDGIAVAPDGHRVFVVSRSENGEHQPVIVDLAKVPPAVTGLPELYSSAQAYRKTLPAWTSDGRAVTYVVRRGLVDNLWEMPVTGGKPFQLTHFTDLEIAPYAWSRDGRLAISRGEPKTDAVLATPSDSASTILPGLYLPVLRWGQNRALRNYMNARNGASGFGVNLSPMLCIKR